MKFIGKLISWIFVITIIVFFIVRNSSWFSNFDSQELLKKYSQEEIDHFANFAFQTNKLKKWRNDINIQILEISQREVLTKCLTMNCIYVLDSLMDEINIQFNSNNFNLSIDFLDHIQDGLLGYATTRNATFKIPYPTINSGKIKILMADLDSVEINSTIYHEFSHILGFHHNYMVEYQSVFNPGPKKLIETVMGEKLVHSFKDYSDLDKAAIRIMYDADVAFDPGLTKEKFYRLINEAKAEIAQ